MALYKRGGVWWYEFQFGGMRVRESSNSGVKAVAERIEREHKRRLELGSQGLKKIAAPIAFALAARDWQEMMQPRWSKANARIESYNVKHLTPHFGRMLLADITADDFSRYQTIRQRQGASGRTINMETGTLRAILRKHRLWANIQPDTRPLKARSEIGRALSRDEEFRLLAACRKSRSLSLYPAVLLSLHTGLRNAELRNLRWRNIDLLDCSLSVGKSKTAGGEGRKVPLSQTAYDCLSQWRIRFTDAKPMHFVFPSERYGVTGGGQDGHLTEQVAVYDLDPTKPCGAWKASWDTARRRAAVECRWHDLRHTFVSRLAESQTADATLMALAGHMSRKMMERYSHVRNEAKRQAILTLDFAFRQNESPQNPPQ